MHLRVGDPFPPEDLAERRDPVDMDALYRSEEPKLRRFFARRGIRDDIVDLVQESFRRLLGTLSSDRTALDSPQAYLRRVAGNLLKDRARSAHERAAEQRIDYQDDMISGADPHRQLEDRDMLARIDAVLAKMKPKTREIFMMHRLDGLSYVEIAERMGMSVKGVEYQLTKALDELRRRAGRR
jgi:RNA polymerase sigma factor (sigma-70 family)